MNDWLAHYGIPRMKWGIRRFQNLNGTWTEEGKARRRNGENKSKRRKTSDNNTFRNVQRFMQMGRDFVDRMNLDTQINAITNSIAQQDFMNAVNMHNTINMNTSMMNSMMYF